MLATMRRGFSTVWAVLALLAACTTGPGSLPASSSTPSGSTSTITTVPSATVPPFEEVTLALGAGPLGDHLVDGSGRSLYLFDLDDERTSTCVEACAERWPPLLGDPKADPGVDQALLGNAERPNGAIQVTYAGHPLYYYSGDANPGDTEGQGFNDVWFLVSPSGEPLTG